MSGARCFEAWKGRPACAEGTCKCVGVEGREACEPGLVGVPRPPAPQPRPIERCSCPESIALRALLRRAVADADDREDRGAAGMSTGLRSDIEAALPPPPVSAPPRSKSPTCSGTCWPPCAHHGQEVAVEMHRQRNDLNERANRLTAELARVTAERDTWKSRAQEAAGCHLCLGGAGLCSRHQPLEGKLGALQVQLTDLRTFVRRMVWRLEKTTMEDPPFLAECRAALAPKETP